MLQKPWMLLINDENSELGSKIHKGLKRFNNKGFLSIVNRVCESEITDCKNLGMIEGNVEIMAAIML